MVDIVHAASAGDLADARELFTRYAAGLGFDLGFQGFEREVDDLSAAYPAPAACILLARRHGVAVGCVAVRPLGDGVCEMKRLFVLPGLHGLGIGRRLALAAISAARRMGYSAMRLDTVPSMTAAIGLYHSLGFRVISPYRPNPVPGALFMELEFGAAEAAAEIE